MKTDIEIVEDYIDYYKERDFVNSLTIPEQTLYRCQIRDSLSFLFYKLQIVIPEKIPLTYNFSHTKIIGFAEVTRDDKGLVVTAETSPNSYYDDETLKSIIGRKIGVGRYYTNVETHESNNLLIVDEVRLDEVSLVWFEEKKGEEND